MDDIMNSSEFDIMDDGDEVGFDFSTPYIKGNPFKDKLKDGYSITVHYKPRGGKLYTYEEIVDNELKRIKHEILEKIKDQPREELEKNFEKIIAAIKTVVF